MASMLFMTYGLLVLCISIQNSVQGKSKLKKCLSKLCGNGSKVKGINPKPNYTTSRSYIPPNSGSIKNNDSQAQDTSASKSYIPSTAGSNISRGPWTYNPPRNGSKVKGINPKPNYTNSGSIKNNDSQAQDTSDMDKLKERLINFGDDSGSIKNNDSQAQDTSDMDYYKNRLINFGDDSETDEPSNSGSIKNNDSQAQDISEPDSQSDSGSIKNNDSQAQDTSDVNKNSEPDSQSVSETKFEKWDPNAMPLKSILKNKKTSENETESIPKKKVKFADCRNRKKIVSR